MKKTLIVLSAAFILAAAFFFFTSTKAKTARAAAAAGSDPADFVLGVDNSRVYRLSDFLGSKTIALAFLDNTTGSKRFESAFDKEFNARFGTGDDLAWFVIKRDNLHVIIEEKTRVAGLRYRARASDIPGFYSFASYPVVVLIDRHGIVKLIYSGYSPTVFSDIAAAMEIPK